MNNQKTYKKIYLDPPVKKIVEAMAKALGMSQKDYVTALIFESIEPQGLTFATLTEEDRNFIDWNYRRLMLGGLEAE